MIEYEPRPYQQLMVNHMLEHPRCALWVFMGAGKTTSTLTVLDYLDMVEPGPALVIAPKRVAMSTWPSEAKKWQHLRGVEVSPVLGTVKEREAALKRDASVYTVNYDNLPWLAEHLNGKWPFTKVVADEATRLKGFRVRQGTARAKVLGKVAHTKVKHFIELTGTPAPNGLADLWGQLWMLDAGKRLGNTFSAFTKRWFTLGYDGFSMAPLPHAQQQIQKLCRDICLSLKVEDWFDIQKPIFSRVNVELPSKARRIYHDMEKEMFATIGDSDVEAFNAAARTMKCLQLANGAIYTDDKGNWSEVHDAKLDALDSIIAEANGAPILVGYFFKSDLARLQKAYPMGRTLDAEPRTIHEWNAGRIPLLFAHPQSAGHGLNLQDGGNIAVFFGHTWNLEHRDQFIERIGPVRQAQAGHSRPVYVYDLVSEGTVDELVLLRHESKRTVQEVLLDAVKART